MSVLVVGSVALDSVQTPFGRHKDLLGGSATYFSIAASYFTDVRLVAVIGRDFPKRYIRLFKKYRIDTRGLEIKDGKTFRWEGEYEYDMNTAKTVATHLNVLGKFRPKIPKEYRKTKHVFLANIDPDLQKSILRQISSPQFIACDTMNFWIENKKRSLIGLLKEMDLCLLNDAEARELSGEANLLKAAKVIISLGPRMVIIKKGEHGCLFVSKRRCFTVPGFPLETIHDPTGAGDTFAGGLMGYLGRFDKVDESKVKKAIIYGSVLASYNVEKFSLKKLLRLNRRLIDKRYKEFKKLTHF
ncbi:MAG: sugar kinase [Candidatus Omnitrophica bacterium]|nr:sugar kinase [Candidatus Omnitrophota bacterium]